MRIQLRGLSEHLNTIYIRRRLDSLKQDTTKWIKHIDNIIKTYNSTEHGIIQIKHDEAEKKQNHLWVNWHLQNAAKNNRTQPKLKDSDMIILN